MSPTAVHTPSITDALWGLMVKRSLQRGWVALGAGNDQGWTRVWICESVSLSEADALRAALEESMTPLEPAVGSSSVIELPWRDTAKARTLQVSVRRTGSAGTFRVGVFTKGTGQATQEDVDAVADLWEALLVAERVADQQAESLREQEAIIEHIADGLLVVDRDLIVKHMNAAAGRILNLNPRISIGQSFGTLLDFQPIIRPILETGQGYVDRELIIDSPNRHLHLMDTAVPIKDRTGRVVSIVNSFREIQRVRRIADKVAGNHARYTFESIIGVSPPLMSVIDSARKAARGFANVLLLGQSGVGKEVFAQAIHNASSRSGGPFVAINCAALPRDLIESELFGYAPGSFTGANREGRPGKFEAASGGTIFLDEIAELPIDVQAKLLRVLQEREVVRVGDTKGIPIDVRLISASNRDLLEMSQRREFREDLYYRCHVIGIRLPALAERPEDVPILVNHFLRRYSQLLSKRVFQVTPEALARLSKYAWPGNVRELENLIERLVNMVDDETIGLEHLPDLLMATARPALLDSPGESSSRVRTLQDVEEEAVACALRECGFNVTEAARRLGISKPTLYAKIRAYRIPLQRSGVRISEN